MRGQAARGGPPRAGGAMKEGAAACPRGALVRERSFDQLRSARAPRLVPLVFAAPDPLELPPVPVASLPL